MKVELTYNTKKKNKPKPKTKSKNNTQDKMKQHGKKYSKKHITIMKKEMKNGATFAKAHKIASKMGN